MTTEESSTNNDTIILHQHDIIEEGVDCADVLLEENNIVDHFASPPTNDDEQDNVTNNYTNNHNNNNNVYQTNKIHHHDDTLIDPTNGTTTTNSNNNGMLYNNSIVDGDNDHHDHNRHDFNTTDHSSHHYTSTTFDDERHQHDHDDDDDDAIAAATMAAVVADHVVDEVFKNAVHNNNNDTTTTTTTTTDDSSPHSDFIIKQQQHNTTPSTPIQHFTSTVIPPPTNVMTTPMMASSTQTSNKNNNNTELSSSKNNYCHDNNNNHQELSQNGVETTVTTTTDLITNQLELDKTPLNSTHLDLNNNSASESGITSDGVAPTAVTNKNNNDDNNNNNNNDAKCTSTSLNTTVATVSSTNDQDTAMAVEQHEQQQNEKSDAIQQQHSSSTTKRTTTTRTAPTRVSWEERINSLKQYKEQYGDLLIPIRYKINPSLGKFVHNMREQYKLYYNKCKPGYKKKCSLTIERIKELENIGFIWTTQRTKKQDNDWIQRFEQLQKYKEKYGDCLVPHGYPEDPSLAEWVHRQRTTYSSFLKENKPNQMVERRMEQLANIGFNFTVHRDKWMEHWEELKQYKDKHGNCLVPTYYHLNPKLGRWTHTQRHQRRLMGKGKQSCMTQQRIDLLDQIGFAWDVKPSMVRPRGATWQQRLDELKEWIATHNNHSSQENINADNDDDDDDNSQSVPKEFNISPDTYPDLLAWAHEQRARLRSFAKTGKDSSKKMSSERIQSLKQIGFTKDIMLPDLKVAYDEQLQQQREEEEETNEQQVKVDSAVDLSQLV